MAKKANIDKLFCDLRWILLKYNGIPSQKVDKLAYAKARRIIVLYNDEPAIQELISIYNIQMSKKCTTFEDIVCKLRAILEQHHGMPSAGCNAYAFARKYIKKYINEPDIRELIREYNIIFRRTPEQAYKEKTRHVIAIFEGKDSFHSDNYKALILKNYFWRYKDDETAKFLMYQYSYRYAVKDVCQLVEKLPSFSRFKRYDIRNVLLIAYVIIVYNNYNILPRRAGISNFYHEVLEYEKTLDLSVFKFEAKIKCFLFTSLYKLGCREDIVVNANRILDNADTKTTINNLDNENLDDFLSELSDIRL